MRPCAGQAEGWAAVSAREPSRVLGDFEARLADKLGDRGGVEARGVELDAEGARARDRS